MSHRLDETGLLAARLDACVLLHRSVGMLARATSSMLRRSLLGVDLSPLEERMNRVVGLYDPSGAPRFSLRDNGSRANAASLVASTLAEMLEDRPELLEDLSVRAWEAVLVADARSGATPEWLLIQVSAMLRHAGAMEFDPQLQMVARRSVVDLHTRHDPVREGALVVLLSPPDGAGSMIFNAAMLHWVSRCIHQASCLDR